jgi:4-amino-4-deoxy-L-arabinose transferase-like glycosyltransferase
MKKWGKKKKNKRAPEARPIQWPPYWSYAFLGFVILFFDLIRIRLLSFPLERDEGEYAYAAQLILRGLAPYQLCYTMKLPGTAAAYALFMAVFGQTATGIHLGLLLVNSATIVLVYFLAERLFGKLGAVVASASFAYLSLLPAVSGFAGHATQFVLLPAVGGILLLLKAIESEGLARFFWSGVLLGLALMMKQPGILFLLFGTFWLVQSHWPPPRDWRRCASQAATLLAGSLLPFALTCLILLKAGMFHKFWFWTFDYAREYGTVQTFAQGLTDLWSAGVSVVGSAVLIWLIAALGLALMLSDSKTRSHFLFAAGFLAFSFAATFPGLYFRNHYFVLMLPAVALLCAGAVTAGTNLLRASAAAEKWAVAPALLFLLALGVSILHEEEFFFEINPVAASRKYYSINPFVEALEISDFLRTHSSPEDRIAVVGSEPEIYFYSHRLSATGYVYMYPLMEPQPYASTMQKEMIAEIEASHPRFLIMVDNPLSWLHRDESDPTIVLWFAKYAQAGYHLVGLADMLKEGTEYHWADAATYRPRSPFRLFVYERSGP